VDRFAVLILPPLMLLGGRAWSAWQGRFYRGIVLACVALSAAVNIEYMVGLYYDHLPRGQAGPFGRVDAFLAAHWSNELPADARVLMVAEARAYYVQRPASYTVVFSPNPLAERIREGAGPAELLGWLADRGYTHLFVNWAEIARLRRTYGFWREIDVPLFESMVAAGLLSVRNLTDLHERPIATLYRIPKP
jgi:hypothetical protein